jgi:hypothetical protein
MYTVKLTTKFSKDLKTHIEKRGYKIDLLTAVIKKPALCLAGLFKSCLGRLIVKRDREGRMDL